MSTARAAATDPPTSSPRRAWPAGESARLLVAAVGCLVLAALVERAYWDAPLFGDDLIHQTAVRRVWTGRDALTPFLLRPHNEHWLPLWKLGLYLTTGWFGLAALPWHLELTLLHAATAVVLYLLLRRYLELWWAAVGGAWLWAVCAVGGTESPVAWLAASHLVWGTGGILAASLCLAHIGSQREWCWAAAMALAIAFAILSMGAMLLLVLWLPIQYWVLERPRTGRPRYPALWLAAWAAPLSVLAAWQWQHLAPGQGSPAPLFHATEQSGFAVVGSQLPAAAWRAMVLIGSAAVDYFHARRRPPGHLEQVLVVAGGLTALAAVWRLAPRGRRLAGFWMGVAASYTSAVMAARVMFSSEGVLREARYLYLPLLAWAIVGAVVLDRLGEVLAAARSPLRRRVVGLGLGVVAGLIVWNQMAWARHARRELDNYPFMVELADRRLRPAYEVLVASADEAFAKLDAQAAARSAPLEILQLPVAAPEIPVLSDLAAYSRPAGYDHLAIVDARGFGPRQFRQADEALAACGHPLAERWRTQLAWVYEVARLLAELDAHGQARQIPVRLGDLLIEAAPGTEANLSRVVEHLFPGGLVHVDLSGPAADPRERRLVRELLAKSDNPQARRWLARMGPEPAPPPRP